MTGETISHYRITDELGRGGMGIVYRAEDTKLDRTVALKLLPASALTSEDDRARFYREARAAASLSHPNIAHVYEIDEAVAAGESRPFIAMEYVDGESLAERIARGPLPIKDAISIATQIAEGLKAAHEKNIVHRDIKSGNVMLTKSGAVKILDFGLAKTAASTKLTRMGSTLGTFAFMSPEQARGEEVDARTDIWSLGVVLYEMITGRVPFPGEYEQAVVYGILNEEPEPPTAVRTGVPMELERIVLKCLSKDKRHRYQHVDEVGVDLGRAELQTSRISKVDSRVDNRSHVSLSRPTWLPWVAGIVFGLLLGGLGTSLFTTRDISQKDRSPVERWNLVVPDDTPVALIGSSIAALGRRSMVLSPDGSQLVYVAERDDGTTMLFRRSMDSFETTLLPGTEGAFDPVFSPDGQWITFFADNKLKKIGLFGANSVDLCEVVNPMGVTWSLDGRLVFANREGSELRWVSPEGGVTHFVSTSAASGTGGFDWPTALPDNRHVLVNDADSVYAVSIVTGAAIGLVPRGSSPRYTSSGHLAYTQFDRIMVAPFDLESLEVTGPSVTAVSSVRTEGGLRFAGQFTVSETGTLVYVPGGSASEARFVWVDDRGNEEPLPFPPRRYGDFRLSPNGKRLATTVLDITMDIWIYDLIRGGEERLTRGVSNHMWPLWSPDGRALFFGRRASGSTADSQNRIMRRTIGEGRANSVFDRFNRQDPTSFSPDGTLLLFSGRDSVGSDFGIHGLSMNDDFSVVPLIVSNSEWGARFSPDGRHIAYISAEEGQYEVYVQPYPLTGQRWKISTGGGEEPVWSRTGREIFYRDKNRWYVVPVETSPAFEFQAPELFIEGPYLDVPGIPHDVGLDGRLLLLKAVDERRTRTQLNVVVNWFEELRGLAPVKG